MSNGPPFSHGTFSRVLDGNEVNIRNRGEDARLGKCLGEGQVECHFVGFPQGRNYSRRIGDAWHPSKTKVGSCHNHQTSPETGKNCQQPMKTKNFPLSHSFPLWPTRVLWIAMKGIRKKEGDARKFLGESQVECHFVGR